MVPARVGPVVKSATAGAAGVAAVQFAGPGFGWRRLDVELIQLSGNSTTLPAAKLYRGPLDSIGVLLGSVSNGNSGRFTRSGDADAIAAGETWSIVWTGCTAGATMTATLSGTERDR